jgi:hypothetical protein
MTDRLLEELGGVFGEVGDDEVGITAPDSLPPTI